MQLKTIQMGWRGLETVVNKIVDAVNGNDPLEGAGIRITETDRGKIIELASDAQSQGPADGQTAAAPQQLSSVWHGVKWQEVDVMDANCNRSTITVLVQTGNSDDSITIS